MYSYLNENDINYDNNKMYLKIIYKSILSLTKATSLHQKKLYDDFISFCDASDEFNYKKGGLNIEKRMKELNFLHLKKHMETQVTKKDVLKACDAISPSKVYEELLDDMFKKVSLLEKNEKFQIKDLLIALHDLYSKTCIDAKKNKLHDFEKEKEDLLDIMATELQKSNKMFLSKDKLEREISYLSSLASDILAMLSVEKSAYLDGQYDPLYDEKDKNQYEEIHSFVSVHFGDSQIKEILNRYHVSSIDELCEKYDKIRKQYELALKLKKEEINFVASSGAVASDDIKMLYDTKFFTFPPSINEMKKLINDRIVKVAPMYKGISHKSFDYETKLLEFYKQVCKDLTEEQVASLYKGILEKIGYTNKILNSNISDDELYKIDKTEKETEDVLKKHQKVFVNIILEKRKITNPTESDYIEIIKDVLQDSYDYINNKYVREVYYVDSEDINKKKKK